MTAATEAPASVARRPRGRLGGPPGGRDAGRARGARGLRGLIGRGRGYLHDLVDQAASFEPLVKLALRAPSAEAIAELLARAWRTALEPPSGPVYVEIPVDLLTGPAPQEPLARSPPSRSAAVRRLRPWRPPPSS